MSGQKRPRGLAAAARAKRARLAEPAASSSTAAGSASNLGDDGDSNAAAAAGAATESLPADSRTVALSGDYADSDDVGQLIALYAQGVRRQQSAQPAMALEILNGTVHEADRILRNLPDRENDRLCYDYHRVYAGALLDLSTTASSGRGGAGASGGNGLGGDGDDNGDGNGGSEGEDELAYINAARERAEIGLDRGVPDTSRAGSGGSGGLTELKLTLAKCLCRKAEYMLANPSDADADDAGADASHTTAAGTVTSTDADREDAQTLIYAVIALLKDNFRAKHYTLLNLHQTLSVVQRYADALLQGDFTPSSAQEDSQSRSEGKALNEYVEDLWTQVLAIDGTNVSALVGCANVWLSLAQPSLEVLEAAAADDEAAEDEGAATAANGNGRGATKPAASADDAAVKKARSEARRALETSNELLDQAIKLVAPPPLPAAALSTASSSTPTPASQAQAQAQAQAGMVNSKKRARSLSDSPAPGATSASASGGAAAPASNGASSTPSSGLATVPAVTAPMAPSTVAASAAAAAASGASASTGSGMGRATGNYVPLATLLTLSIEALLLMSSTASGKEEMWSNRLQQQARARLSELKRLLTTGQADGVDADKIVALASALDDDDDDEDDDGQDGMEDGDEDADEDDAHEHVA